MARKKGRKGRRKGHKGKRRVRHAKHARKHSGPFRDSFTMHVCRDPYGRFTEKSSCRR